MIAFIAYHYWTSIFLGSRARVPAAQLSPGRGVPYSRHPAQRRHGPAVVGAIAARVGSGVPFAESFERETGETPDAAASRAWAVYRRWTNWVPALTSGSAVWALILVISAAAYVSVRRRRIRRRRAWDDEENRPPPPLP